MTACYNEIDNFAADWLENLSAAELITAGRIDRRSITEVTADDVRDFTRVHFFAGIAGWEEALRLAGWPIDVPVWTGSCPCQPFSCAGKGKGTDDERHLWPEMRRLIDKCRPAIVFGEQVASKAGREWLAGVRADMEALGYAVGAADLCAASVGAPHIRQRLFWVGIANSAGLFAGRLAAQAARHRSTSVATGGVDRMAYSDGGSGLTQDGHAIERGRSADAEQAGLGGKPDGMGDSAALRWTRSNWPSEQEQGPGAGCTVVQCRDNKARRIPLPESGVQPLAHGIPRGVGRIFPELRGLDRRARSNRVGRLKGYGNAIVPEVAAEFIAAAMEVIGLD